MPKAISDIVVEAAEAAKIPERPVVLPTQNKDGKMVVKKVEPVQEDLPEEKKDYDSEYFGKELDDQMVESGMFEPIPKKLLGL